MRTYSYLAIGDSYTIGELVLSEDNFPNQTVAILNENALGNFHFSAPVIIAKTGFTTDELNAAIDEAGLDAIYDFVSLLIGVNNQYRGRPIENFEMEFTHLLQRAIDFANGMASHVFVLSIPDWGVTPFAEGKEREKIATEIDAFNLVCKTVAEKYATNFIEITKAQREDGNKIDFLVDDNLHPSGKEYKKWAIKLADEIFKKVGITP